MGLVMEGFPECNVIISKITNRSDFPYSFIRCKAPFDRVLYFVIEC